ncbi:Nitro/flavin reductase [Aspergillus japonicus CBS 114.51]|uniref:Nitro/flavin reductase n=1 Tax=Aspergillus japonicus CBS 114.51 TaxID=1448312 RepID=A0A8T8X8T4_ASPJA|nr:Nitro/flavin reductase [Aspergillus japonicus CBS 114.51]RAH84583.1 Nitro/flavin reductase [Aspergillus japonicus CBS 114.51]
MGDSKDLDAKSTPNEALQARYLNNNSNNTPPIDASNPVLETIWRHKSIRHFLPSPLPDDALETLIASAQSASTASMLQTWSVVAVQDPSRKAAAAQLSGNQDFIRQAPLTLFFCADLHRLTNVSEWEGQAGTALEKTDMFIMSTIDAAVAAQNVALAAESLGLGICYVGGARNNAAELCELLALPPRVVALFGMAVGWPDLAAQAPDIKPRLPMQEVLHRERWDGSHQRENVERYNASLGAFYEWHQMFGRHTWAKFVAGMLASGELDGRERIGQVLRDRGFGLQ